VQCPIWLFSVVYYYYYYYWWHINITKNIKLFTYQAIMQGILMYGAGVWKIPNRKINKILSTEMDVLRTSARK